MLMLAVVYMNMWLACAFIRSVRPSCVTLQYTSTAVRALSTGQFSPSSSVHPTRDSARQVEVSSNFYSSISLPAYSFASCVFSCSICLLYTCDL